MAATEPKKKRLQYTHEALLEAVAAVNNGSTVTAASREFGVPRQTLKDKVSGKFPVMTKIGRPSILSSDEEKMLSEWIIEVGRAGFPVSKEQLLASVGKLMQEMDRQNPFKNKPPGERWYHLFLKRHPEISARATQPLTTTRAAVTEEKLSEWFREVYTYLKEQNLEHVLQDKSRIFNSDETAFFLCPKGKKVLVSRGEKKVHCITGNDDKECLTTLITANAAGMMAPPLVLFSYKRIPSAIANNSPPDWGLGTSDSGWMTGENFYEFIANLFHPWLIENNIETPVIFFVDGHVSHITYHLSKFCENNGIVLISLYPNSTHLTQPMDVAVFHPLKSGWRKAVEVWRNENGAAKIKKEQFCQLLKGVLDEHVKQETIINGFEKTGLTVLDPDKVDFKRIFNTKKRSVKSTDEKAHEKWLELKNHLNFVEKRLGGVKLNNFKQKKYSLRDEGLYLFWRSARNDLLSLKLKSNQSKPTDNCIDQGQTCANDEDGVEENMQTSDPLFDVQEIDITTGTIDTFNLSFDLDLGETKEINCDIIYLDNDLGMPALSFPETDNPTNPNFQLEPKTSQPLIESTASDANQQPPTISNFIPCTPQPCTLMTAPFLPPLQAETEPSHTIPSPTAFTNPLPLATTSLLHSTSTPSTIFISSPSPCTSTTVPSPIPTASTSSSAPPTPSITNPLPLATTSLLHSTSTPSTIFISSPSPCTSTTVPSPIPTASTSSSAPPTPSITTSMKIPSKSSSLEKLKSELPSPFKKSLLWPEKMAKKNNNKSSRQLFSSPVVSSQKWQEFYIKKEKDKQDKEEEKAKKKKMREEKAAQKKTMPKKIPKKRKISIPSEDEDNEEENTNEDEFVPVLHDLEEDPAPKKKIKESQWVVVPYELGRTSTRKSYFVGQVLAVDNSSKTLSVKFLERKPFTNKFIWPKTDDIDLKVPVDEVVKVLKEPSFDKWGNYFFDDYELEN